MCEQGLQCGFKLLVYSARKGLFNHNPLLPDKLSKIIHRNNDHLVSSVHVAEQNCDSFLLYHDLGFLRHLFPTILNMKICINNCSFFAEKQMYEIRINYL